MEQGITRRRFGSAVLAAAAAPAGADSSIAKAAGPRQGPRLDEHDVGSVLASGKPYFPMLLGNGQEHVLIGYSGAMGACAGHEHWSYGTTVTGWFRPGRKAQPAGAVANLLQCGYILRQGIHADGIDIAEQVFDARSGVLLTRCRLANAECSVKTFLTGDHRLVHRFTVTPGAQSMSMQFFVGTALPRGPLSVAVDPKEVEVPRLLRQRVVAFAVRGEGWPTTPGWLFCDHPEAARVTCYNRRPGIEVPLSGRSEFTFVVECSDPEDSQQVQPSVESAGRFDYSDALGKHQSEWQRFDDRSTVHLSRGAIDDLYRTSLYTVRAHQHPATGAITVGAYPGMWSNGVNSYDVSYSLMGLLGANRMEEAELVVRFWQRILPSLRQRAREAGLPGAACPAPMSPWGQGAAKSREEILEERHFITANIPLHVWQLYQHSGRLAVLKEYWDCLAEPVEFLLGACVEEFPDHAEIVRSSGPNGKERVDGKVVYYPNPIRTLLATIEAVRAIRQAARLLNKEPDPRWEPLLPKLERGIRANEFGGVIRANRTPKAPPRIDAAYLGLFDCLSDKATLVAEIEHATGPEGFMRWPDHGYRAIPWSHLNVSAALARLGLPGAAEALEIAARLTTTLHGFPEAVRPDGVYSKTWYPTVHGALIHAVNLLLVRRCADAVELFAGLPAEWGDASFHSLRAPLGLVISASRTAGKISAEATNDCDRPQSVRIRACGAEPWEQEVRLSPGQTASLP